MSNHPRGFSLIEVVVSAALVGIVLSAVGAGLAFGVRKAQEAGRRAQATALADEGLAAAQNMRDADWANLMDGTWGITVTGGVWAFSGVSDAVDVFTRAVNVASVDSTTKDVTSTVTWTDNAGGAKSVALATRFTNWMAETVPVWLGALYAGLYDLSGNADLEDIVTAGDYAYGIRQSGSPNFFVFDVTTTSTPTLVGSSTLYGTPQALAVDGDYVYVASTDNSRELQVVSVAFPALPVIVGTYDATSSTNATAVAVTGSTVVLTRDQSSRPELYTIDVSVPALPVLLGSVDLSSDTNAVAVSGSYAYVASNSNTEELQIVSIATLAAPSLTGVYDRSGSTANANTVAVGGSVAYLGISSTLYMIDVATPASPTLLGSLAQGGTVNDIALGASSAQNVFVATSYNIGELRLVDARDPTTAVFLSTLDLDNTATAVAYSTDLDIAVASTTYNAGELMVFTPL